MVRARYDNASLLHVVVFARGDGVLPHALAQGYVDVLLARGADRSARNRVNFGFERTAADYDIGRREFPVLHEPGELRGWALIAVGQPPPPRPAPPGGS